MGQTLTHGVYLPDEGERNCYDGLAANWQLLDTSVGTIAAHTAALAGKAPAVHTHTKSDITDLLNSNFVPSANNSYNLGSSNYQWNNIYSKQYYGENVLITKNNTPKITIVDTRADRTYNATQTEESACRIEVTDKDNAFLSRISTQFTTDKRTKMLFTVYTEDTSGNQISKDLLFNLYQNGTCSFNPGQNNAIDLGSSSYQWKTLNGVNPGALSLPNLIMKTYDPNNGWYDLDTTGWDLTGSPIDISSNILKDGYLYVCLACDSTGYVVICEGAFEYPNCYYSTSGLPVSGYARALLPVRKGTDVRLYLKGTSVYAARLFPALGNV